MALSASEFKRTFDLKVENEDEPILMVRDVEGSAGMFYVVSVDNERGENGTTIWINVEPY